jgi:hypothetical protein
MPLSSFAAHDLAWRSIVRTQKRFGCPRHPSLLALAWLARLSQPQGQEVFLAAFINFRDDQIGSLRMQNERPGSYDIRRYLQRRQEATECHLNQAFDRQVAQRTLAL